MLVDDTDVKSVTLKSLREQMGIMTQDNFLFSGTIKDNIRYGKLDATDEEIIEAARSVHAHDFISKLEKDMILKSMSVEQGYLTVRDSSSPLRER